MKKRLGVSVIAAAMLLTASCSKIEMNVDEVASKIATEGSFTEQLTEVSDNIALKRFNLDESLVEDCALYAGTKAVVDEIAVFKAADITAVREKIDEHIAKQTESYTSYRAEELPKIDDALIREIGDYIILCIGDTACAEEIIKEYTK